MERGRVLDRAELGRGLRRDALLTAAALLTLVLPTLPPAEARPSGMPWQIAGVAPVLGLVFVVAVAVGAVEALTPAHVEGFGADPALAGLLLAVAALVPPIALTSGPVALGALLLAAALPLAAATVVGLRRGVRPRVVAEDAAR